jgi:uroporphyrinogen-III synthase
MRARAPQRVALLGSPDTLAGVDERLKRAGVRLLRLASVEPKPVVPAVWLDRALRRPAPDTIVVTSRVGVEAGVRPWRRVVGRLPAATEFWAVGPGTAQALLRAGVRRVRRPATVGADALVRSLGGTRPRRVAYFRSDAAGPRLARALRRQGHRVTDLVVYRLMEPHRGSLRARRQLLRADLLVVTSPSGLAYLRREVPRADWSRLARSVPLVVLGERSRRAAKRAGFRHVSVAPSTTAQRFTRHLLRELRDARN